MSKDYCSGLFGHSPWQFPVWSYGGLPSDHDLRSINGSVYPAGDACCYSNLGPALRAIHGFAADSHQILNEQLQPLHSQCHNPSVQPRGAFHQEGLKASSYDCRLQLKKLDLGVPLLGSSSTEKKFIVFDQSGSQRSMFISSINSLSPPLPLEYANQTSPNGPLPPTLGSSQDVPAIANHTSDQTSWEESKVLVPNDESEMHENTEDLEALLCSDDDAGDDEVASTGHSPSIVTARLRKERDDNFSLSTAPLKRRKIDYSIQEQENDEPLADTASSSCKSPKSTDSSRIGNSQSFWSDDSHGRSHYEKGSSGGRGGGKLSSVAKKLRKEKIRNTVGILRSILPGGTQKDATMVLDEAIQYLRSLKLKVGSLDRSPW